jgi:hypothetical protein
MDKVQIHRNICNKLNETYANKNHDYGDSFSELRKRFPNAILVRLFDKYMRIESLLSKKNQKVTDESIYDTLLDMANYCIMELVEMEIESDPNKWCAV